MRLRSIRTLVAGAAALALVAGGATALASSASGSSDPSTSGLGSELGLVSSRPAGDCRFHAQLGDPLRAAADYIGISVEQLTSELRGGASLAQIASQHNKSADGLEQAVIDAARSDLDESVAAGDLSAAEEQQMLSKLRALVGDLVNRTGGLLAPPSKPPLGDPIRAAADYLGLSVDQLGEQLKSGKSLADVAKAQNKSVDGLEQVLIDAAKSGLDESVSDGDITADQEQQVLEQLRSQMDQFVSGDAALSIQVGDGGLSIKVGGPEVPRDGMPAGAVKIGTVDRDGPGSPGCSADVVTAVGKA